MILIHFKLEFLMQFPASNGEKYYMIIAIYKKTERPQNVLFHKMSIYQKKI